MSEDRMAANLAHFSPEALETIEFAKRYAGKPIIEPAPQPAERYKAPAIGQSVRAIVVNGEARGEAHLRSPDVLRSTDAGGPGTGSGLPMYGTMAVDPATVAVNLGGVGMSAEQARQAVAKGWFTPQQYGDAIVDAMQIYEPGFAHASLPASFR